MICKNCGNNVAEGARFCGYCGHPMEQATGVLEPDPKVDGGTDDDHQLDIQADTETDQTEDGAKSKRRKKEKPKKERTGCRRVFLIAVILLIIIALIAAAVYIIWRQSQGNASVSFGEISVDEIYFIAGENESAVFTVPAPDAAGKVYLCDEEGKSVGQMTDDGENGDEEASDGIYTCTITFDAEEAGEASYYAKSAGSTSGSVTVYFFAMMTEEEEEAATDLVDEVSKALRDIESGYAGESGYVTENDFADILSEADAYLETKTADGTVLRYVVEDGGIYIKFASGISLCYQPVLEDTFSGEDDVELTITYYQPCDGNYIADSKATMSEQVPYIENLTNGASYTGEDVTLQMVKNLPSDQIIVWYGHGGYSSEFGSYVIMATRKKDYKGDEFLEKQKDLIKDNLTTAYVKGDDEAHIAFTAGFVEKYCGDLSNDIIFLSCCKGGMDTRLADSFISCGASAVLCFTDSVFCPYAESIIDGMLIHLMYAWPNSETYYTLDQALDYVKDLYGENDDIWFTQKADLTDAQRSGKTANGAEPLLVDATTTGGGSGRGTDQRISTETGSLSGTAWYYSEDDREPAAGATVLLYQSGDLYMSLTTDENGEYSIPLLPAGAYDIVFSLEGYSDYYLDGTGVYRDQATVADGYFLKKPVVTGTVVDGLTGEPLAGTEVKLIIETDTSLYIQTTSTDENGDFEIDLTVETETLTQEDVADMDADIFDITNLYKTTVPMKENAYITGDGYIEAIEETGTLLFSLAGYEDKKLEITAQTAGEQELGTIELMPEIEIYGYIFDEEGNSLEGVSVTISLPEEAETDSESEEDDTNNWWQIQVSDDEAGEGDMSQETEDNSETIEEYTVADKMQTDADGGYATECYASVETVRITCALSDYATTTVEMTIDAASAEDGRLRLEDIILERPKITGTVVDAASGEALPGVTITITGGSESSEYSGNSDSSKDPEDEEDSADAEATENSEAVGGAVTLESGSDGTFRQRMETLGTYTVTFEMEGYESTSVQATLTESAHADLGTISLAKLSEEEEYLISGVYAYATSVISFTPGDPWTSDPDASDPSEALGAPNYSNDKNAVTFGAGGVLVLAFDVDICDGEGIDIYVYECGGDVEPTLVEVSNDLVNWTVAGTAEGALSGVDLNGMVPEGTTYRYVRLTDLGKYPRGTWPGADVDAVAIVNYMD